MECPPVGRGERGAEVWHRAEGAASEEWHFGVGFWGLWAWVRGEGVMMVGLGLESAYRNGTSSKGVSGGGWVARFSSLFSSLRCDGLCTLFCCDSPVVLVAMHKP